MELTRQENRGRPRNTWRGSTEWEVKAEGQQLDHTAQEQRGLRLWSLYKGWRQVEPKSPINNQTSTVTVKWTFPDITVSHADSSEVWVRHLDVTDLNCDSHVWKLLKSDLYMSLWQKPLDRHFILNLRASPLWVNKFHNPLFEKPFQNKHGKLKLNWCLLMFPALSIKRDQLLRVN